MSPYGKEKTQLSRNEIVVFFHSKLNDIAHKGSISIRNGGDFVVS